MKDFLKITFQKQKGFTLIELLIVVAIIGILAVAVVVSLNPLVRFQDARDSVRWTDITAILSAAKIDQVDNGGGYASIINNLDPDGTNYMIGTCTTTCNATPCDVTILAANGVNLTSAATGTDDLVTEGYLASVPVSADGDGTWSSAETGYYLSKSSTGSLTVGACESENTASISITR